MAPDGPYSTPNIQEPPPPERGRPVDVRLRAIKALGLGLAPMAVWASIIALLSTNIELSEAPAFVVLGSATLAAIAGAVISGRSAAAVVRHGGRGLPLSILALLVSVVGALFGALLTLFSTTGFSRGRQIRRLGKTLLPPLTEGSGWVPPAAAIPLPAEERAAVAEAWRDNGKTEHASVAAFAGLSMDLVALGAPPELIRGAHQDALDEMRHTELCFALARSIDGSTEGPGAFPGARRAQTGSILRSVSLARLAVDSLIEGALNEGVSARVIAALSKDVEIEPIRRVLREIAQDEARHAAHGWEVLEWCLDQTSGPASAGMGPASSAFVRAAVVAAVQRLPATMRPSLSQAAADGRWERFGIPGRAREEAAYLELRSRVVRRAGALLEATGPARSGMPISAADERSQGAGHPLL